MPARSSPAKANSADEDDGHAHDVPPHADVAEELHEVHPEGVEEPVDAPA